MVVGGSYVPFRYWRGRGVVLFRYKQGVETMPYFHICKGHFFPVKFWGRWDCFRPDVRVVGVAVLRCDSHTLSLCIPSSSACTQWRHAIQFSFRRITRQGTPQFLRCVHVHTCCVHLYIAAMCLYVHNCSCVHMNVHTTQLSCTHVCSCCHRGGMLHNSCSS